MLIVLLCGLCFSILLQNIHKKSAIINFSMCFYMEIMFGLAGIFM